MKKVCVLLMLLVISGVHYAAVYQWNNALGDRNFADPNNWSPVAPDAFTGADDLYIETGDASNGPILDSYVTCRILRPSWTAATSSHLDIVDGAELAMTNAFYAAYGANTTSTINMSGGLLESPSYASFGGSGTAYFNLSGGVFSPDRTTLGAVAGGVGEVVVSNDGWFQLSAGINVGTSGRGLIRMIGKDAQVSGRYLQLNSQSSLEFVLDGAGGVGGGIALTIGTGTYTADLYGTIDVSFLGTPVPGTYTLISAGTGSIVDNTGGNLLSASSVAAGWIYNIVNVDDGQELQATYPLSGQTVLWTNGSMDQLWTTIGNWTSYPTADDTAVIDLAGADKAIVDDVISAGETLVGNVVDGELSVITGGNASFVNLRAAGAAGISGNIDISGGSVEVLNTTTIGNGGDGSLSVSGTGSLDTYNLVLGATGTSQFTLAGSSATVNVEELTCSSDSMMTFKLDGANGVGSGIVVGGDAELDGKIKINFLNGSVEGTYTLITAAGTITDNSLITLIDSVLVSYEIVQDGDFQKFNVTVAYPETCAEVIAAGFGFAGDVDEDCDVDMVDFSKMAEDWVECNDPENPECIANWI